MTENDVWIKRFKWGATYGLPFVWAAILFIFLNVTSPLQSGPLSVLLAFVLIYLLITSGLYSLAHMTVRLAIFMGWSYNLQPRTLYYLVSVVGLGPVFILALNTLGRLEIKEVLLVLLLLIVGCFYVLRRGKADTL